MGVRYLVDEVRQQHAASPSSHYAFESWVGYLEMHGLVESRDNEFHLTVKGQSFLRFGRSDREAGSLALSLCA